MTKVTIKFNIDEKNYAIYNHYIDGILNILDQCYAENIEVKEK